MLINLKVKTLDARTHDFSIDNEITIRQFKDQIAEKTTISADNQRLIYQGRVLADEKQIKEYDVDGKVLHVAERPPFSQRGANARNNDEPRPTRSARGPGNLRNSPLFRAIDGMLLGTMTIPVNASGVPNPNNIQSTFSTSSSFCMNRITVARHMINCANNIAAYLEDPERGLNNPSLDILERGRWTMESTVVEVGVAADMPRNNQNLIDMVQGAVTAALSRNNRNRNYTVLQLPSVFTSNEEDTAAEFSNLGSRVIPQAAPAADNILATDTIPNEIGGGIGIQNAAAALIIEDDLESPEGDIPEGTGFSGFPSTDNGVSESRNTDNGGESSANRNASNEFDGIPPTTVNVSDISIDAATNEGTQNGAAAGPATRRRTGTAVLSGVIEQYRRVQTRLNPFIEQYYELLRNEPTFGEDDTRGRENAQRIFDRVSEAFHYISHAMHAISDLMLDLSNPAPRYLTCRPILVEQSGYIRSNNVVPPPPPSDIIPSVRTSLSGSADASVGTSNPFVDGAGAASSTTPTNQSELPLDDAMDPLQNAANGAARATTERPSSLAAGIVGAANTITEMAVNAAVRAANAAQASAQAAQASAQAAQASVQAARVSLQASQNVEDPVDEPIVAPTETPRPTNAGNRRGRTTAADTPEIRLSEPPRFRLYVPYNPQAQMARFLQAVVNSATHGATEVQVQVAPPNVISINVPTLPARSIPVSTLFPNLSLTPAGGETASASNTSPSTPSINVPTISARSIPVSSLFPNLSSTPAGGETASASNTSPSTPPNANATSMATGANSSAGNDITVNANTITLPTTSTQTRSTSRPQLQIGGGNNWGPGRFTANTAFDRFLPCNSHHIRESDSNTNRSAGQAAAATNQVSNSSNMDIISHTTLQVPDPRQPRQVQQQDQDVVVGDDDGSLASIEAISSGSHDFNSIISGSGVAVDGSREAPSSSRGSNPDSRRNSLGYDGGSDSGTTFLGERALLMEPIWDFDHINAEFPTSSSSSSSSSSSLSSLSISNSYHSHTYSIPNGTNIIDEVFHLQQNQHLNSRTHHLIAFLNDYNNIAVRTPRSNLRVNRSTQSMGGRVNATTMTQQQDTQSRSRNTSQTRDRSSTRSPTSSAHSSTQLMNNENLRTQLRTFVNQIVFEGGPINEHTTPGAINRALSWFDETLHYLPQYEKPEYNSRDSVCNILRLTLDVIIKLCNEDNEHVQFEQRLKQICEQLRTRLYSVLFVCVGSNNAELYWRQLMRLLLVPLESNFRNEALQFLCIYLNPTIPASTDTDDVKQFLVLRSVGRTTSVTMSNSEGNGLDGDIEMADVASTSDSRISSVDSRGSSSSSSIAEPTVASVQTSPLSAGAATLAPEPTLPQVRVGSESWHSSFPTDWLPTITRDIQSQNENPPTQPPYSDAYISGMSAKRRKIIQTNKPSSNVGSLIADSVRRALIANGLGPSTASSQTLTADAVTSAISQDSAVQSSYTEAVRTNMRERLKNDPDFKKDKYPQTSKFINDK